MQIMINLIGNMDSSKSTSTRFPIQHNFQSSPLHWTTLLQMYKPPFSPQPSIARARDTPPSFQNPQVIQ